MDFELRADFVDEIHRIVISLWILGFCVRMSEYPRLRLWHAAYGLTLAAIQIAWGTQCPLTVWSDQWRELAHPGSIELSVYRPFISKEIYGITGVEVPKWIIDAIAAFGTGWMIFTIYRLRSEKRNGQRKSGGESNG